MMVYYYFTLLIFFCLKIGVLTYNLGCVKIHQNSDLFVHRLHSTFALVPSHRVIVVNQSSSICLGFYSKSSPKLLLPFAFLWWTGER
jgi:hypothetical protein